MPQPVHVSVEVPATTANLGPGFDCLGMALQLHNRVEMTTECDVPLKITVSGKCSSDSIPLDEQNLVYRSAARVFERAQNKPSNLHIHIHVEAPLARGLGSSASAIVGGAVAANALLGQPLGEQEVLAEMMVLEGHPDNLVPCYIGGLTASLASEKGIFYIRRAPHPDVQCVLLVPDYELATAKARQAIPKSISVKDAVFNLSRVPFVLEMLTNGDFDGLTEAVDDRIHQPYRTPLIKGYDEIAAHAAQAGAAAVCISGAGPTILAIARRGHSAQKAATAMREAMKSIGIGGDVLVVNPENDGARTRVR